MQTIDFIEFDAIAPSETADFVAVTLRTDTGSSYTMLMQRKDYNAITSTDLFFTKYMSYREERPYLTGKKTA